MFQDKNVLVAGGAGFVGANLIQRLLDLGAHVRATLHEKPAVIDDARVEYMQVDLLKAEDCRKVCEDMDFVFMWAAFSHGAAVIKSNPVALVTPNVIMNTQMLDAAYTSKVSTFIWPSSSVVYPTSGQHACMEEDMLKDEPYDIYYGPAWMKRYGEILCRLYSEKIKNPMATVVVRPANIYGPHDDFDFATSHVMAATLRKVAERHNPIKVWGTGEDIRDFIYVDDFIEGVLLATEKIHTYDPVNLASGQGYSVKDILRIAMEVEGATDLAVEYDTSKPSMIPIRLMDAAKAEELLGFRTSTSLEQGIIKTLNWFKNNDSVLQNQCAGSK